MLASLIFMVPTFYIAYGGFDDKTKNNKKSIAFGFPSGYRQSDVKVQKGNNGAQNGNAEATNGDPNYMTNPD